MEKPEDEFIYSSIHLLLLLIIIDLLSPLFHTLHISSITAALLLSLFRRKAANGDTVV